MKKITKKEIVSTLRTYDATKICALMKRCVGSVPISSCHPLNLSCIDGFRVYLWAKQYATSKKMNDALWHLLDRCSHHWKVPFFELKYKYSKHGAFEPLPRQRAHIYFEEEKKRGHDSYTKVPTMGHTWLYACSPVYGHKDYNKHRIIPIKGNERFCEILINKYSNI